MSPLTTAHASVRGLQAITGAAALIFTSLGYVEFKSGQLSSNVAVFAMVANYTAMLCGAYYAGALHMLQLSTTAPRVLFQRGVDVIVLILVAMAGILHATSKPVTSCEAQNTMFATFHNGAKLFRCGNMSVAIILTFATAGLFVVSLVQSLKQATTTEEPAPAATASAYDAMATPVAPGKDGPQVVTAPLERRALRVARLGSRAVQFSFSTLAFACIVTAFKHYYIGQYISPKSTFAILAAYTCALYSLWHLVAVEKLQLARRPGIKVERVVDGLLAFAMLAAGVVVATAAHVRNCEPTNATFATSHHAELYRCGNMTTGVVATFVSIVMYVATIVLSFLTGGGGFATNDDRVSTVTVDENHDVATQA